MTLPLPIVTFDGPAYQAIATAAVGDQTVTLRLSQSSAESITVNLIASGAATYADDPIYGDSSVLGEYYSLSANSVTFSPGDLTKTVTLTTKYRKTSVALGSLHVPFYRAYLTITASIDSESVSYARIGNIRKSITIKLNDDVTNVIKDYKRDYSGVGDGVTDETDAIQTALDGVKDAMSAGQTGILYFPPGTYKTKGPCYVWPGVVVLGEHPSLTTVKRLSQAELEARDGITLDPEGRYWYSMFQNRIVGEYWQSADDSPLGGYRNIKFDGNCRTYPDIQTNYTQLEPSMWVISQCAAPADNPGKIRTLIENCQFYDNVTSDIAFGGNTWNLEYNTLHEYGVRPSGKGVCSLTTGNTVVYQDNVDGNGRDQWDIELNSDDGGYYEDSRYTLDIKNSIFGQAQFGGPSCLGTQTVTCDTVTFTNIGLSLAGTDFTFTDCTFNMSAYGSTLNTVLRYAKTLAFTTCTFNTYPDSGGGVSGLWPDLKYSSSSDPNWTFTSCIFNKVGSHSLACYAIDQGRGNTQVSTARHGVTVDGCTFNGAFDAVFKSYLGAQFIITGTTTITGAARVFQTNGYDTNNMAQRITVTGPINSDAPIYYATVPSGASTLGQVYHTKSDGTPTVVLTKSNCEIVGTSSNIRTIDFDSSGTYGRLINGTNDTTPTSGLKGDKYVNTVSGQYWNCTVTGYVGLNPTWDGPY